MLFKIKNIISISVIVLLFFFGITGSNAQVAIVSAGGDILSEEGSMSFSIGQVAYITNIGINGSVAEGVQQAFEISILTGIDDINGISLKCTAYPNPTTNLLFLKVENYKDENLLYQLFNMDGRLLENKRVEDFETTIPMSGYVPATYFLQVSDKSRNVKTFKIIKH